MASVPQQQQQQSMLAQKQQPPPSQQPQQPTLFMLRQEPQYAQPRPDWNEHLVPMQQKPPVVQQQKQPHLITREQYQQQLRQQQLNLAQQRQQPSLAHQERKILLTERNDWPDFEALLIEKAEALGIYDQIDRDLVHPKESLPPPKLSDILDNAWKLELGIRASSVVAPVDPRVYQEDRRQLRTKYKAELREHEAALKAYETEQLAIFEFLEWVWTSVDDKILVKLGD